MASKSLEITKYFTQAELLQGTEDGGFEIGNLEKARVVIENAGGGNEVVLRVKIKGQSSYTTLTTLTGNTNVLVDIRTYDLLQIECTTHSGTPKFILVGYELPSNPAATYDDFASFPTASGSGDFAWDTDTQTMYFDEPATSTWITITGSGGGPSPLTSTYVGYGSGANELTGESAFTYNATTNTMTVENISLDGTSVNETLYKTETFTLLLANINTASVTLSATPATASKTRLIPEGGPEAFYTTDFTVSGSLVSWSGLGLDGILEVGDKITIVYS